MKIVGIACSPRKAKTTALALDECLKAVQAGRTLHADGNAGTG